MNKISERHLLYSFFVLFFLMQFFILLFSGSTYGYGGADNITHYQIAKYAFKYPALFLDLWGKPVYTTLLAPFALLGYHAAKFFNLVAALLTLWISAKISNRLYPGSSLFTVILIAFSPIYFLLAVSCLTEVMFSLVLITALWLFLNDRFPASAAVLSFLPFVRSEGIVILPVFALAFILKKSYRSVLYLAAGTALYSIIGYFHYGDILWVLHKQPYSLGKSLYGSGSLFHFIRERNSIFGFPLVVLIVAGLTSWGISLLKRDFFRNPRVITFIVIAGSWITFFAAHSYVWWKGTGGSLGLIRVMGGVLPLAALTGMEFYDYVSRNFKSRYVTYGILSVFALLQVFLLFRHENILLKPDPTEELIRKSADYIRFNEEGKKVFYFNPLVIHFLELDPYDTRQCNWWVQDKNQPSNSMEWGDLLVWDAQFGPNEGAVQLETLEKDPNLKKLKSFYPVEKVTVLGGYDYSVQVFKKSTNKGDTVRLSANFEKVLSFSEYQDPHVIEADGSKVWNMDKNQEYGPTINLTPDVITRYEILEVTVTLSFKALEPLASNEAGLVFSAEENGKSIHYEKADLISTRSEWKQLQMHIKMSAQVPANSKMLVYVWNLKRKNLLLKELKVEMKSY
jgi:hypothetical protein